MNNPLRLSLLINIGLIMAQARVHAALDKHYRALAPNDPHDDPHYFRSSDLWFDAVSHVIELAERDHRIGFTPENSPVLSEFGLLDEYWDARERLAPSLRDDYED